MPLPTHAHFVPYFSYLIFRVPESSLLARCLYSFVRAFQDGDFVDFGARQEEHIPPLRHILPKFQGQICYIYSLFCSVRYPSVMQSKVVQESCSPTTTQVYRYQRNSIQEMLLHTFFVISKNPTKVPKESATVIAQDEMQYLFLSLHVTIHSDKTLNASQFVFLIPTLQALPFGITHLSLRIKSLLWHCPGFQNQDSHKGLLKQAFGYYFGSQHDVIPIVSLLLYEQDIRFS